MAKKDLRLPVGYTDCKGNIKVAISFPKDLFKQIRQMAVHDNKKFSIMVSELCGIGLFDLSESDRLEPTEQKTRSADQLDLN
jgi:hypothetical protein